jgi:clan AA aspartic protease (TIGR02281 family)
MFVSSKQPTDEYIPMKKFLLATCFSTAAISSAFADTQVERVWYTGPIAVRQLRLDAGPVCEIDFTNGTNVLAFARGQDGSVAMAFTNGQRPALQYIDFKVSTDANPVGYAMRMEANGTWAMSKNVFAFDGAGRDLLHELWNGTQVTVSPGMAQQAIFSLNGSTKALNAWYSCADAIGVAPVPPPAPTPIAAAPIAAPTPAPVVTPTPASVAAPAPVATPDPVNRIFGGPEADEIKLTPADSGTMELTATVNGQSFIFTLDSGASDICMPENFAKLLVARGFLARSDFLRMQKYGTANGEVDAAVFRLKTVTLGNQTVHNVEMAVIPNGHDALLGQAFFRRFKTWTVDNSRNVLVLGAPI